MNNKKKVIVGISGGVDSSITLYLLLSQGYETIPVFMIMSEIGLSKVEKIQKFTESLGLKLLVKDIREKFRATIIEYMLKELEEGRTPNPCALCNKLIKYQTLLEILSETAPDGYISTGHYVFLEKVGEKVRLRKALDTQKTQEYFVSTVPIEILGKAIFPMGIYTKQEVKFFAKRIGLQVAEKKESQELCFLQKGDNPFQYFLRERKIRLEPAKVYFRGRFVGKASFPAIAYTIGQRSGLGLSLSFPVYVEKIDAKENVIFVDTEENVKKRKFFVDVVNWIEKMEGVFFGDVKIRYKHEGAKAKVEVLDGGKRLFIEFLEPQFAITPGQLAVVYNGPYVIVSGWIREVIE